MRGNITKSEKILLLCTAAFLLVTCGQKVGELVLDMDILNEENKLRPFAEPSPLWKSGE